MKFKWNTGKMGDLLKQYRYVLIVIVAGILLLIWPSNEKRTSKSEAKGQFASEEDFSVDALEERLCRVLSKVEGAGEVSVVLTVQNGVERVLATDKSAGQTENSRDMEEEIVIISGESGEEVVLLTQRYPTFQGALVVCPGGDDPQVRLQITQAVAVLTGLGADRITVCKGS